MKRPSELDENICVTAAHEWVENNTADLTSRYYFIGDKDKEAFKNDIAKASRYEYNDAYRIADKLSLETTEDLIEDIETYLAHRRTVYERTVQQWVSGWGPKVPLTEKYTRVAAVHRGKYATGLAQLKPHYQKMAQILLYTDDEKEPSPSPISFFSMAIILNLEDVVSIGHLTDEDISMIDEYEAYEARREQESTVQMARFQAQKKLNDEVKKHKNMQLEEAETLVSSLNVSAVDIPKILAALTAVGVNHNITSATETAPAPGFML